MLQVALLVGTNNDYDRKIISGVSRYARAVDHWTIFCEDEHLHKMPSLSGWSGEGVIAQLENPAIHQAMNDRKFDRKLDFLWQATRAGS